MTRLASVSVGGTITAADTNATRTGVNKAPQLMTPTSVSTGSIGTYGAVTFSAASAISINGCFTSEFDWYEIHVDLTVSGAANVTAVLRLAGTDAVTAYDRQSNVTVNTTATPSQALNQTSWLVSGAGVASAKVSGFLKLFNPALAVATTGVQNIVTTPNPMTTSAELRVAGIQHRTTTAYDGITLTPSTGTITGTIRVYGII